MSTRTRIGYEQEDGTIRSIYCHSDGYPSWTGKKLRDHYDGDEAKVVELVDTGYISCLFPTVEECVEKRHNTGTPHIASDPDAYYTSCTGRNSARTNSDRGEYQTRNDFIVVALLCSTVTGMSGANHQAR